MEPETNTILNLNQMLLPLALLKVTGAFRKMKKGETLEILTDDRVTRDDLFKVLQALRCDLIESSEMQSVCRILLRKI